MTKLKSSSWDAARWSTRITNHVTRSDWYDQHYCTWGDKRRQCQTWEDDDRRCQTWRDDDRRYQTWGDDNRRCQSWGDDDRKRFAIVWLGNLELQFVIKEAVVHLNWGLSSVVAKWKVISNKYNFSL